jgi:hypothetical protein
MNSGAQQCPKLPKTIPNELKSFKAVQTQQKEKPADFAVDLMSYKFVIPTT